MVKEKIRMPPVFVIAGFVSIVFFLIMLYFSATIDGKWEIGVSTLSSLGDSENGLARSIFNYGCCILGVLGIAFGTGMMAKEINWLYVAGFLSILTGLLLMSIGAIPVSYNDAHGPLAQIFGAVAALAMAASIVGDWCNGRRALPIITAVMLLISLYVARTQECGLFELVSVIFILLWMVMQSYKYLKIIGMVEYDNPLYRILKRNTQ